MADYYEMTKTEDTRLDSLTTRQDADVSLLRAKYVMQDKDEKHRIPDIVNVTLNKVSLFAAFATSELTKATQQPVVTTEDKQLDTTYIEEFQNAAFASANDMRRRQGKIQLNSYTDIQNCFRGRSAARCLFYMDKDGNLVTDITSWDTRYFRYGMGSDGLDWASYGWGLERTKDDIESQPWAIEIGFTLAEKKGVVLDVWTTEGNIVYVDKDIVYEQEHAWDFCPVALSIVSLGYGAVLLDDDSAQYEGESIFFLIRNLVPELNRVISISQTLNFKSLKPPIKQKLKGAASREQQDYEKVMASAATTIMEPDEDIQLMEYGDIKASFDRAYTILEKAIQEGSFTNVDIGDPRQPFSAVALIEIGETRGQLLLPRLASKSMLNETLAEMFTKQVTQIGGSVELGAVGHKRTFETSKLDGEYSTEYKYFIKDPKMDIAKMSIAATAERFYDPETILTDVLKAEDPKGIMRKRYQHLAEQIDPNVLRHRAIMSLIEAGEEGDESAEREAEIMVASMKMSIEEIKAGRMPEAPQAPAEPTMPLLGQGGRGEQVRREVQPEIPSLEEIK